MPDCNVCLTGPEDGCIGVLFEKVITARKTAKCGECRRPITPGERYHCVKGMWEGEFLVYRTCMICHEIREGFTCNGYVFEGLWEDFNEYLFEELNEACFSKLNTVEAKRYLRERWIKWKGLAA